MSEMDRLAIAEAMTRYSLAIDALDREGYLALFAEDAELVYVGPDGTESLRVRGTKAIGRVFDAQAAHRRGTTRHVAMIPAVIGLEDDVAETASPFVVTTVIDGVASVASTGLYRDRWARFDGRVRLVRRIIVLDAIPR